ncbi:hypothetical protein ACWEKU_10040, partial [Streptomyces californicus]
MAGEPAPPVGGFAGRLPRWKAPNCSPALRGGVARGVLPRAQDDSMPARQQARIGLCYLDLDGFKAI